MGRETKFDVSAIRRSGDRINDAVNLWAGAAADIDNAVLDINALGICGERARLDYSGIRDGAFLKMTKATNALIEARESVYRVANVYAGIEDETRRRVSDVAPTRTIRSDIVNPPS
jgi:hypothetical protein